MWEAERPFVYAGGGVIAANASDELRALVETLDAPAVCTLMGLGALPPNIAISSACPVCMAVMPPIWACRAQILIIALGIRFDDRVTGRLAASRRTPKSFTSISILLKSAKIGMPICPSLAM